MSRIMMQARDVLQPLRFGARSNQGPLLCSSETPWSGLPFELHRRRSATDVGESGPAPGELGLMVVTRGGYETTLRSPRGDVRLRARPGTMVLLSGDHRPHVLEVVGDAEVAAIRPAPEWRCPVERTELGFAIADGGRTARTLVAAMGDEIAGGCGAGPLYAESLSFALLSYASHLLFPVEPDRHGAALSKLDQRRVASYIRDHLDHDLDLTTLAALVGMQPRRFSACFRHAFRTTPHQYVMRSRLREGARLLATSSEQIAAVAVSVGFSSQSHFTTAFRQAFGETPKEYARRRRVVGRPIRSARR